MIYKISPIKALFGVTLNLALFFNMASPQSLYADMKAFVCNKDLSIKEGEVVLTNLQKKYNEVKTLSARFVQYSHLAALDTSELSQGNLVFTKPGKMKWTYHDPEPQEFIADGKTLWFYQPTDNQVMVDNFKVSFRGDLPVSFLIGIGDIAKDFNLKKACKSSEGIILELLPKKGEKKEGKKEEAEFQKISLLVEEKGFLPIGAEIFDPAGNKNSFIFSELDVVKTYPDGFFSPEFPKGTDIIDNRKAQL